MELPNYRLPGAKNVGHLLWDKAKDFLQRAFTVIFIATIVIWFLQNFDMGLNMVSDSQNSILALVAGVLAPNLPAGRIWRLENCDSIDFWIYGKGERCVIPDCFCSEAAQHFRAHLQLLGQQHFSCSAYFIRHVLQQSHL